MAQIKPKKKATSQSQSKKTIKYAPALEMALANNEVIKIDLGCGAKKQPGFIGIDNRKLPGVDIVQDVTQFPLAVPSDCASLVMASHLVEHITRENGTFLKFMDEIWRILKTGGQFMIAMPYAGSPGYYQDPTHVNPCNEFTWSYFDPLSPGRLYYLYFPKPWKIISLQYSPNGNMEIVLEKRKEDPSYKQGLDIYG